MAGAHALVQVRDSAFAPLRRVLLNGKELPDTVDVSASGVVDFLTTIPERPVRGAVSDGLVLPALGVSLVCYSGPIA